MTRLIDVPAAVGRARGTARVAAALVLLATATLPGCFYEGSYLVRGTVSGARAVATEPLAGAEVAVMNRRRSNSSRLEAETATDGSFELKYPYGGMGILFFTPGDGDPIVEFTMSGYRACTVRLRGDEHQAGVTRRPCSGPSVRCYALDVILSPDEPRAAGACSR